MSLLARIEGAPEEMECEGSGCRRCSYAVRDGDAWACVVELGADPLASSGLGRFDDSGRSFGREDVATAVRALSAVAAPDAMVALRLFRIADAHHKPVRMGA